jgi:hypothetical protein
MTAPSPHRPPPSGWGIAHIAAASGVDAAVDMRDRNASELWRLLNSLRYDG